jgi:hypothetical protein
MSIRALCCLGDHQSLNTLFCLLLCHPYFVCLASVILSNLVQAEMDQQMRFFHGMCRDVTGF